MSTEYKKSLAPTLFADGLVTELAVPITGKYRYDRATAIATSLADRWDLPVRLIHVFSHVYDPVNSEELESARGALAANYPTVDIAATLVEDADVVDAIVRSVRPGSLVVLSSEHADDVGSNKSIAEAVMREIRRPVLFCGPESDSEHIFGSVVIGLDGSPTAEAALGTAVELAKSLSTKLWLVRVVDMAMVEHIAALRDQGKRVSESAYLKNVSDRLEAEGVNVGWQIEHNDNPIRGLLNFARHQKTGPVVAGTHGDSELARRTFGSTAMGLVQNSRYPVLVVKTGPRNQTQLSK